MRQNNAGPQEEKPVRGGLLTIDEAARYIRMGKTTLYECINDGSIPFFFRPKKGKILLDTADLDGWLRKSKSPPGTAPGICKEAAMEK
jgi:excisionase family DNA binding protein